MRLRFFFLSATMRLRFKHTSNKKRRYHMKDTFQNRKKRKSQTERIYLLIRLFIFKFWIESSSDLCTCVRGLVHSEFLYQIISKYLTQTTSTILLRRSHTCLNSSSIFNLSNSASTRSSIRFRFPNRTLRSGFPTALTNTQSCKLTSNSFRSSCVTRSRQLRLGFRFLLPSPLHVRATSLQNTNP